MTTGQGGVAVRWDPWTAQPQEWGHKPWGSLTSGRVFCPTQAASQNDLFGRRETHPELLEFFIDDVKHSVKNYSHAKRQTDDRNKPEMTVLELIRHRLSR